jgi:ATP-dependent DNA ligase
LHSRNSKVAGHMGRRDFAWTLRLWVRRALLARLLKGQNLSLVLNETFEEDGKIVFREACKLGCEGIVSKRLGLIYRRGRSPLWVKVKNPNAPAVKREAEEDWGK